VTGFLMYHELERPGRALAHSEPGYVRYAVSESRFGDELAWLASAGLRGISVRDACANDFSSAGRVVITFDDGCETDWVVAAPRLLERGFGATFYVVSDWIGSRGGFLEPSQLRQLADAGFEVGSHSATHAFLSDLGSVELQRELVDSKKKIAAIIGRDVTALSCPGGRWNRAVADAARAAGYTTMATSRIGANGPGADRFALARCAIQRDTPQATFEAFARGRGLSGLQLRDRALTAAKTLLGNRLYVSLRNAALRS
jgi:peptidoglycan/xylan/chitin deacetylase (PgdA/CDA1 family)